MAVVAPVSKTVDIVEIDVSNMTIYKKNTFRRFIQVYLVLIISRVR